MTTGPDGAPVMFSGESACVFRIAASDGIVAICCFTGQVMDHEARYASLQDYLSGLNPDPLVDFQDAARGIKVGQEWYPMVMVEWAEGDTLDRFISGNIDRPDTLGDLAARWRTLDSVLRTLRIAHNDLEHGNIAVRDDGVLHLVDYDGMFIPQFQGQESLELGHRNYRHPTRDARDYNESIDNFPSR